ncbi:MAG: hypothetical protein KKA07_02510 [Bacteroidetes bacterium]|nr:hypothetical protein [Bacteroidota bacterium]MBU1717922.1 hypothetical protein [Bacteroidota bacterium]
MKKIAFVLGTAFIAAIALSSCKKDWTCECSLTSAGTTLTTSSTINATKKDAQEACDALEITVNGVGYVCELK